MLALKLELACGSAKIKHKCCILKKHARNPELFGMLDNAGNAGEAEPQSREEKIEKFY